jgi:hypothetical protein
MNDMYNALNEDFLFQEMNDRIARMNGRRRKDSTHPNRRWWHRADRVAG